MFDMDKAHDAPHVIDVYPDDADEQGDGAAGHVEPAAGRATSNPLHPERVNGHVAPSNGRAERGNGHPGAADMQVVSAPVVPSESFVVREPDYTYGQHRLYNILAFAAGDALALMVTLLAAGVIRLALFGAPVVPAWGIGVLPLWWAGAAVMRLLPGWGLGVVEELRRLVLLLCIMFASVAIALFLSKQSEEVSRMTVATAFAMSLFIFPLVRNMMKRLLIRLGLWGIPTAVYGAGATGRRVISLLHEEKGLGYDPIVVYDDRPGHWGESIEGVPVLGSDELVMPFAPVAILAMPSVGSDRLAELMEGPLTHYRTVLVIPNLFEGPSLWVRPRDLSGMLGLEVKRNLSSPKARAIKRTVDIVLALLTSPLWLPVCSALAAAIWLEDRANPLFAQQRMGTDGKPFTAWKFRTMVPDAEEALYRQLEENEALREEWQAHHKLKDDPRITRTGRLLRRFSLDELPQLFNVLRGEMSLVGPRPLPTYHASVLSDRVRALRERVRPGMTGLWQVSGRSAAGTKGMEKWDPYYVRNWSLWLDLVILVRTLHAVARGSGAY